MEPTCAGIDVSQGRSANALSEQDNLAASVPGVGSIIARTLIAEMPGRGSLDRRAIAACAGLAPFTRQSGPWKDKTGPAWRNAEAGALMRTTPRPTMRDRSGA